MESFIKETPGELDQIAIDENETFLSQNFSESDNRNFRDGDTESSEILQLENKNLEKIKTRNYTNV